MSENNKTNANTVSGDELAAGLVASMPSPTDSAVIGQNPNPPPAPSATGPAPEKAIPSDLLRDKKGRPFDATRHKTDENGYPRKDARGFFVPKDIGRAKKENEQPQMQEPGPASFADVTVDGFGSPPASDPMKAAREGTAESYLQIVYSAGVAVFGPDVRPTAEEHEALKMSGAEVIKHYNVTDVHPVVGFVAVGLGVFLGKLEKPTVRERFDALVAKLKAKFQKKG